MSGAFSAESRLIHAGTDRGPGQPAAPPLVPASIYVSEGEPRPGRCYGRDGNPSWEALEEALGGLEEAQALAFASGQAASMALMLTLAQGREQIVLPADGYYGARVLADKLRPHGVVPVPIDLQDVAAVTRELKAKPSLLWAETPTKRIARQSASALAIARHLAAHPSVRAVHYPGVEAAMLAVAKRQMPDGFGPLLSFEVDPAGAGTARQAADQVVASARLILPATSFGGVESTWERRARWPSESAPGGLIRLSVGVEPAADLIADIDEALSTLEVP